MSPKLLAVIVKDVSRSSARFVSVFMLAFACASAPARAIASGLANGALTSSVFTAADVVSASIGAVAGRSDASARVRQAGTMAPPSSLQPAIVPAILGLHGARCSSAVDTGRSARISSLRVPSFFVRGPPSLDFALEL
jgi:hypothetical protein